MIDERMEILCRSLEECPVVWRGEYPYFIHPVTDGVPRLSTAVLNAIADMIHERVNWEDVDIILGIEAMGLPISTALSARSEKPMVVARKRSYGLPGEVKVGQITGYSEGVIYLNDINKGERVLVVDDVLSTGGTLEAIFRGLNEIGAEVASTFIVVEKGEGRANLEKKSGYQIDSLVKVKMVDGKVICFREKYGE